MNKIFLSVVIPSYNEMANLQKGVLDKVAHFLGKQRYSFEVIIVDDGSTDGSVEFVKNFVEDNSNFKLIKNHHLGKAGAVTNGMLSASGEYILFTDMDQATPIEEINKILPYFSKGFDIVIGSRNSTFVDFSGAPGTKFTFITIRSCFFSSLSNLINLRTLGIVSSYDFKLTATPFVIFKKTIESF